MRKIIAIDFDGTLCENKYPKIGRAKWDVIERIKNERKNGTQVILWTCRGGKELDDAVSWCNQNGIMIDAINDNVIDIIEAWGCNPRKIFANEYWDDKGVKI